MLDPFADQDVLTGPELGRAEGSALPLAARSDLEVLLEVLGKIEASGPLLDRVGALRWKLRAAIVRCDHAVFVAQDSRAPAPALADPEAEREDDVLGVLVAEGARPGPFSSELAKSE